VVSRLDSNSHGRKIGSSDASSNRSVMRLNQSNVTTSCFPLFTTSFPRIWKKKRRRNTFQRVRDREGSSESEGTARRCVRNTVLSLPTITQKVLFMGFCTILALCCRNVLSIRSFVKSSFVASSIAPFITQISFPSKSRVSGVTRSSHAAASNAAPRLVFRNLGIDDGNPPKSDSVASRFVNF